MSRLFTALASFGHMLSLGVTGYRSFSYSAPINVEEKFLLFNIAFVDCCFLYYDSTLPAPIVPMFSQL